MGRIAELNGASLHGHCCTVFRTVVYTHLANKAVGSGPIGPVWAGPTFGAWWVWCYVIDS